MTIYIITISLRKLSIDYIRITSTRSYSIILNFVTESTEGYKAIGEKKNGNHDEKSLPQPIVIPEHSRVYVQTAGDHIFTGLVQNIYKSVIPIWVLRPNQPHHPVNLMDHVFIQMPNGEGLTASIHSLTQNIKNSKNKENTCFIRIRNHNLLIAFLEPYNHDPAEIYDNPIIYVRMPDQNDTVYSGELHYGDGYLPGWFSWDD